MKIWDVHGRTLDGAIRGTPDGMADIQGLVLSEKAYFLVLRDYRPAELVEMVERAGPVGAGKQLVEHFAAEGRGLVLDRLVGSEATVRRADEVRLPAVPP